MRLERSERAAVQREARRRALLTAALQEAETVGYQNITRRAVASRAGVANGAVNHEFGTMVDLRDALMNEAVSLRLLPIVAQGLASGHPAARNAPADLRNEAARDLI